MKTSFLIAILILVSGCSSAPEKVYQVSNYEQASSDLIRLADRKRQLQQYDEALALYLKAEEFALKRNNQRKIGISKLKRALIYIIQDEVQQAEILIVEVEQANQIEKLNLEQAITFIRAKLLLKQGDKAQALALIEQLETFYQSDEERRAYYRLTRWSHDYSQLDPADVQQMVDGLTGLFEAKTLNNIEILSFAYSEHARWAVDNAVLDQGQRIIEQSIDHFSQLELTPKIAQSLKFAAEFYDRFGLTDRSAYYHAAYRKLVPEN
jgi:hypothetical protein